MTETKWRKQLHKYAILIAISLVVMVVIVFLCLMVRGEEYTETPAPEPTTIELSEEAPSPTPYTSSIPDGSYKVYLQRHLSILPKTELPIASTTDKPYNKNTFAPYEPEPPEPIYGTVEVPENAELVYLGEFYITGYDVCVECCGKIDGITASGAQATVGRTVAATKDFAFGTTLYIDGIGARVVEDRGGMRGDHLDVLCEDHPACYAITGYYDVWEVVTDEMP